MPQSRHRQTTSKSDRQRAAIHRRIEMQRAHEQAERRAVRRKRRNRVLAVVGCILVVATPIGILVWKRATAPPPPPSLRAELVDKTGAALPITSEPAAYRIRYQIETFPSGDGDGKKPALTTEDVTIRRPFEGQIVEREGAPPGGKLQLDIRSALGLRGDYSQADAVQVTSDAPSQAIGDIRLNAAFDQLIEGGFLKPRERRRVLGRECQVYRTGLQLESLSVSAPSEDGYADACVDASGLLLEELAVSGGKLTTRVTAIEVDDRPTIPASAFTIEGTPKGLDAGGVGLERTGKATDAAPVAAFWRFPEPPAGFEDRGRFLLVAPDGAGTPQGRYVDVFVRGPDMLLIEQGPTDAEPEPPGLPGQEVDEGPLGTGTLVPGLAGNILTVHPGTNWFIRVTTTLTPQDLQRAVSGLKVG